MKRAVKEVLKFEVIFKRITLCLVNLLLNEIYQTYVSSKGVFYELSVVINIVMLCIQEETFTIRQVMVNSVWNLKALKGSTLVFSSVYYLLLLPLVSLVYINSLVPKIEIPRFILGEMQRTEIGTAGNVID